MLEAPLVDGLVAGGADVVRIGLGPAGTLYYVVHELLDGGIMVTGSHNPADQNGFKLLLGREPVYGTALAKLFEFGGDQAPAPGLATSTQRGQSEHLSIECRYFERLLQAAHGAPALRIGWDTGNGATGEIVARLIEQHRVAERVERHCRFGCGQRQPIEHRARRRDHVVAVRIDAASGQPRSTAS